MYAFHFFVTDGAGLAYPAAIMTVLSSPKFVADAPMRLRDEFFEV